MFRDVPECSGMFRDVPCSGFYRRPLVLAAKGIDYECVNVNLKDKPDWFLDLNPGGTVPVIEQPDGAVIYESAICCGRYTSSFCSVPRGDACTQHFNSSPV